MKNRFFTTIDLLISISIIIVLTGMFLLNYRMQGKIRDLTDACNIIIQRIRKAQNMAMAQSKFGASLPLSYGLYFELGKDTFDIFADIDGDYWPDAGEGVESIFLPLTIQISNIEIDGGNVDPGRINFLLKDMSVKMNGGDNQTFEIEICIKSDCATNTKRVILNNKGMIEIQ